MLDYVPSGDDSDSSSDEDLDVDLDFDLTTTPSTPAVSHNESASISLMNHQKARLAARGNGRSRQHSSNSSASASNSSLASPSPTTPPVQQASSAFGGGVIGYFGRSSSSLPSGGGNEEAAAAARRKEGGGGGLREVLRNSFKGRFGGNGEEEKDRPDPIRRPVSRRGSLLVCLIALLPILSILFFQKACGAFSPSSNAYTPVWCTKYDSRSSQCCPLVSEKLLLKSSGLATIAQDQKLPTDQSRTH